MIGLGIYHYQSRFYSPKLGRFLSADSIVPNMANPQMFNRFSYVENRPINFNDPDGHESKCFIEDLIVYCTINGEDLVMFSRALQVIESNSYVQEAQEENVIINWLKEIFPFISIITDPAVPLKSDAAKLGDFSSEYNELAIENGSSELSLEYDTNDPVLTVCDPVDNCSSSEEFDPDGDVAPQLDSLFGDGNAKKEFKLNYPRAIGEEYFKFPIPNTTPGGKPQVLKL